MKLPETVAAIAENEASGDTARIYAEIRETLGIVNLIWRHLATFDGALDWAWSALRPAYRNGAVSTNADYLRGIAHLQFQSVDLVPVEALHCLGLTDATCTDIADIVASYDRSNAANLTAFNALLLRAQAGPEASSSGPSEMPINASSRNSYRKLPPILSVTDLDAPTAALVVRLNELCSTHERPIQVSIYRHLGHWPAVLSLAWAQIAPLAANGQLERCSQLIARLAQDKASLLAATMQPMERHPVAEKALAQFLERIGLSRMIAITAVHAQSLGLSDSS